MNKHAHLWYRVVLLLFCVGGCSGGGDGGDDASLPPFQIDACSSIGSKIFSGESCDARTSPIVLIELLRANGDIAVCSGSAVSDIAVLTAAHCFLGDVFTVRVVANGRRLRASSYILHPQFEITADAEAVFADLAIIFLPEPLQVSTFPLLGSRATQVGEEAVVGGYGLDDTGSAGSLKVGNTFVSLVTENHVFTEFFTGTANPCEGDSGGPLLLIESGQLAVSGVVSTGRAGFDCEPGDITLYSNIFQQSNIDFVLTNVPDAVVL